MEDNNGYYKDAFSFIDYCNNDNMIWDLAYNARVEAMRALLTSDNVDLTKKNEVGHDALYVALGNVFFNISEQCKYAVKTYAAASIASVLNEMLRNDLYGIAYDDKYYKIIAVEAPINYYRLIYARLLSEKKYVDFKESAPELFSALRDNSDITSAKIMIAKLEKVLTDA